MRSYKIFMMSYKIYSKKGIVRGKTNYLDITVTCITAVYDRALIMRWPSKF